MVLKKQQIGLILIILLVGCSSKPWNKDYENAQNIEELLDTNEIFHRVAYKPNQVGLNTDGFLVGIEKSACGKLEWTDLHKHLQLTDDLKYQSVEGYSDNTYLEEGDRKAHFEGVFSDPKQMSVTHILEYTPKSLDIFSHVKELVVSQNETANIYKKVLLKEEPKWSKSNRHRFSKRTSIPSSACEALQSYNTGWRYLAGLKARVSEKLEASAENNKPYSHLYFIAMGWNNDQTEVLFRANSLLANVAKVAKENDPDQVYNPLAIVLSWPSVWFGDSDFSLKKIVGHLSSYANKANDADEVGYLIGNYILNNIVLGAKKSESLEGRKLKVIAMGHSMGARVITRAAFSRPLLKETVASSIKPDAIIGLQGAFSIRRFVQGVDLNWFHDFLTDGEGYPYTDYEKISDRIVMTWSASDSANPVAHYISGAHHIGGIKGYEESKKSNSAAPFDHIDWPYNSGFKMNRQEKDSCDQSFENKKVHMVNMTPTVHEHNDVVDNDMARLIWCIAK